MRRLPYLLLATLAIAFFYLSSCRAPKDLEYREIKNLSFVNLTFSGATLKADVIYYNPNNFGLELNRTDLDIFVDSSYLGHSSQNIQVAIPRRDIFTIPLEVELDMKNLLKNSITSLLNKDVLVRIVGKVKVGKAGVYKSFNIDYQTVQHFSLF